MALTLFEELEIIQGNVKPGSYNTQDAVHQAAIDHARDFYNAGKVFDESDPANADAAAYKRKMDGLIREVYQETGRIKSLLVKVMFSILGDTGVTAAQVAGADLTQWSNFINNNIVQTMEIASRIDQDEKTAYDALP